MPLKIAMIGAGYVGLVSSACFADFGHEVVCVDLDADRVASLGKGEVPLFEPDLETLMATNMAAGRLAFSTDLDTAVAAAEIVFIAVGTPARRGDGYADLSDVHAAAAAVARAVRGFTVVATKSTVPVGTGDEIARIVAESNPRAEFAVVANPEFLREGAAINDFKRPDRIIVGVDDERARAVMQDLYQPLHLNQVPILFTTRRSAEIIKYAANSFLAMKITFINEIADLCEAAGGDVQDVARGIGLDNRIGSKFLQAGPGIGGSCFPKDATAFARTGQDFGTPLRLVEAMIAVNERRKRRMAQKIVAACEGTVAGKRIAVLGLTFKPNTDDMREAPALALIEGLLAAGARVCAYDPQGMAKAQALLPEMALAADAYEAARGAECLVIVTEWDEFRSLDFARLQGVMRRPVLVDLRNIYGPAEMARHGFAYAGIGRGTTARPKEDDALGTPAGQIGSGPILAAKR